MSAFVPPNLSMSAFGAPSGTSVFGSLISTTTSGTLVLAPSAAPVTSTTSAHSTPEPSASDSPRWPAGFGRGLTTTLASATTASAFVFDQPVFVLSAFQTSAQPSGGPPLPDQPLDSGCMQVGGRFVRYFRHLNKHQPTSIRAVGSAFSTLLGSPVSSLLPPASLCVVRVRLVNRYSSGTDNERLRSIGTTARRKDPSVCRLEYDGDIHAFVQPALQLRQQRHRCLVNPLNRRPHSQDALLSLSIQQPTQQPHLIPSQPSTGGRHIDLSQAKFNYRIGVAPHASVELQPRTQVQVRCSQKKFFRHSQRHS
ncbi:hypothetical protein BKA70DRAFT_550378 [Coprinopsis sp. MPI-PUGE-AT-0042]|nr:hypothetical protein BKA70DRAFT_550378 [Coprinopsis sp. MPI-PUGE-AT-0042]